ncbi:unnamed protein product [Hydatigera taeniaeformis]|uniref:14_3_3 domain-containing protein n=1 Tax=Hydatigena taeniaeformis TaxID=6205 RepID=A0A0R3WJV5_HYDTA|nr:unnamed protein product [Hydatigera taeniaeformis]
MASKDGCLYNAKLAEQAGRFDGIYSLFLVLPLDMVSFMDSIVRMNVELKADERNLLSIAYKNALLPRRRAWDEISVAVQTAEKSGSSEYPCLLKYRETVEAEIRLIVRKLLAYIDSCLLKDEQEPDIKAFYYKLNGDCYRYLAEFETGNDRSDSAEHSLIAYKNAFEIASGNLAPTHPLRLGIALNFAVFYFDIVHAVDKAYKLLQSAYDDAIAEIDNLSEEPYKESTIVMRLLKENMQLWLPYMQSEESECCGRPRS